ncbi:hypothetical protein FPZ12_009550 [Amycolatopsis acidicola]|uniref:Uncharacterized protein n=1 Tax=Amycolatopsis acidicola TaxID=2596893 RepID=A0A5N0VCE1_9PSEU|nr:hypothetical protein [Amycolatopsis acidicola]KAA9163238.1 hypothetical protein FPZ12_009550 [Amycolatopsis acidicola]
MDHVMPRLAMLNAALARVGAVVLPDLDVGTPGTDAVAAALARSAEPRAVETALGAVPLLHVREHLRGLRDTSPEEFELVRSFVLAAYLACPDTWRVPGLARGGRPGTNS